MKGKWVKILAALACLTLTAGFIACGGNGGDDEDGSSTNGNVSSSSSIVETSSSEESSSSEEISGSDEGSVENSEEETSNGVESSKESSSEENPTIENGITFNTLKVDGANVYGKVSNATETFSFADEVKVSGNAKYLVSLDEYGTQTVITKTIPLSVGDNKVYIFETADDEITATYIVTVRRRPMYSVTFNVNGGSVVEKQTVEEDGFVSVPETMRRGYTLTGWDYDFTKPITTDITIEANWDIVTYTIDYDLQCGTIVEGENPASYTVEDTFTLVNPQKANHTFLGWYNGDEKVETVGKGYSDNLELVAKWEYALIIKDNVLTGVTNAAKTSLTEIVIPDGVTSIGGFAFSGWSSLTEIEIPDSVNIIWGNAFYLCNNLQYTVKEGFKYLGNENNPYVYLAGIDEKNITFATIESSCKIIGDDVFYNCDGLTKIEIPNSVTSIGDYAFEDCDRLTAVTFGENSQLMRIGNYTFQGCSVLAEIIIPDSVTSINFGAFQNCSALTEIIIPDSVTEIGVLLFADCSNLTKIALPDRVNIIMEQAFEDCSSLTEIVIPDDVTSIGDSAFAGCSKLTEIKIPDGVMSIGEYAFYGCSSLTEIVIPDGVTSIGRGAFQRCSGLTSITISFVGARRTANNGYDQVFGWIFGYTKSDSAGVDGATLQYSELYSNDQRVYYHYYIPASLRNVTIIGGGVTSIGKSAFLNCSSLTEIIIPDSITIIGDSAFNNCRSLTEIIIPDSVTSIGKSAFLHCSSLTEIIIPDCVTSIGDRTFDGCSGLTEIIIPDGVTSIGDRAFDGCNGLTKIIIPDGVTNIGAYAFNGCYRLTEIVISDSVTSIGSSAFYNCSSLTSVYYKGTEEDWSAITIYSANMPLTNAMRYYYSESEPALNSVGTAYDGNYWRYVDGVVTPWVYTTEE